MTLIKTLKHLFHPQRSNNHRPKVLHPRPLIFMSLIAVGFFQLVHFISTLNLPQGSVLGYASDITIAQVIKQTNIERSKQGLTELNYSSTLSEAALAKAQDMFSNQYWAHISPTGKEPWDFIKAVHYRYKVAGENLARDFDSSIPMVEAWMNSPTHRANIMNPRYRDIGLAVVDGKLNGVETTLVVQMFGTLESNRKIKKQPTVEVPTVVVSQVAKIGSSNDVLATTSVPQGSVTQSILMSPLSLTKAMFLSIVFLLISVLIYDAFVIGHRKSVRLVGKNLAHIILFLAVAYLVVFFKGGMV